MPTQETTPLLQTSSPPHNPPSHIIISSSSIRDEGPVVTTSDYALCGRDCTCPTHARSLQPRGRPSLSYHFPASDPAMSTPRSFASPQDYGLVHRDDLTPGDVLVSRGNVDGLEDLSAGDDVLRWYRAAYDRIAASSEVDVEEERGMFCSLQVCFSSFWSSWARPESSDEPAEESRPEESRPPSHESSGDVPVNGTVFVPPRMGDMRYCGSPDVMETIEESEEESEEE
ncbi:hypothetical protein ACJ41O_000937 [Fusarium nematophilum]